MKWPPDYTKEAERREQLYMAYCSLDDPRSAFVERYKDDPVSFINDWCWTFDPRNTNPGGPPTTLPFIMFLKQEELILFLLSCLEDQENGLIEKCRAMGASWCCVYFAVWLWLFNPGTVSGFGSQLWDNADKVGDMTSLLEKARFTIERLPWFARPNDFDRRKHAPFKNIKNPENGCGIIAGGGDQIGRGGRTSLYFCDESAHYERPDAVQASLSATTNVIIDISSVNGTGNLFYRKAHSPLVRKFIMDWRDHPAQDQKWYDKKRAEYESMGSLHTFAQEIERDYSASVDGIIIPGAWVRAAIDAHIKLDIPIEGQKEGGLDVADEGGDTNALAIRHGILLNYISEWGDGDTSETTHRAATECGENGCSLFRFDSVGVGAGVKAEAKKLDKSITAVPYNGGSAVNNPDQFFIDGKKNKDMFKNLKAQSWWNVRTRFYKTWRMVEGKEEYPHDELISLDSKIPLIHKLVNELSQPTRKYDGVGRLMVDKKPDGTKSPNLADAVVMAYDSTGPKKIRMAFN